MPWTWRRRGVATTLIERRPFAGGKTFSFTDPDSGVELDNGQHVYLRCCTAYIDLNRTSGSDTAEMRIQPRLQPAGDSTPPPAAVSPIASATRRRRLCCPPPLNLSHVHPALRATSAWARSSCLGRAVLPLMRMNGSLPHDERGEPPTWTIETFG